MFKMRSTGWILTKDSQTGKNLVVLMSYVLTIEQKRKLGYALMGCIQNEVKWDEFDDVNSKWRKPRKVFMIFFPSYKQFIFFKKKKK